MVAWFDLRALGVVGTPLRQPIWPFPIIGLVFTLSCLLGAAALWVAAAWRYGRPANRRLVILASVLSLPWILIFGGGIVIGLNGAVRTLNARRAGKLPPPTATVGPKPVRVQAAGASFSAPRGWVRTASETDAGIADFEDPDSSPTRTGAMVSVYATRTTLPSARKMAEALTKRWAGKVLYEATTLDGVEAVRFRRPHPGTKLEFVECIAALRRGRIYVIAGGMVPGRSLGDAVEQVRMSWKWVEEPAPSASDPLPELTPEPESDPAGAERARAPQARRNAKASSAPLGRRNVHLPSPPHDDMMVGLRMIALQRASYRFFAQSNPMIRRMIPGANQGNFLRNGG